MPGEDDIDLDELKRQTSLWTYGQQAAKRADTCPNGREWCPGPDSEELGCLGCFEVDSE